MTGLESVLEEKSRAFTDSGGIQERTNRLVPERTCEWNPKDAGDALRDLRPARRLELWDEKRSKRIAAVISDWSTTG